MSDLKVIFRRKQNKRDAQALLELTIWGGLMLMVASMMVSYIMYLIYRQDIMIRNFRSAVRFAADKGATGSMVYQVMVEHRKIPSIGPNFMPGYREIQHVIGVIWSWNMMWKASSNDPDQTVEIVKYIVDGKDVSEQIPKNPNANALLPRSLRSDDRTFLVISVSPEEYVSSKTGGVLELLNIYVKKHYPDTYNMIKDLADSVESYFEMSDEEKEEYLNEIQTVINNLKVIRSDLEEEKEDSAVPSVWENRINGVDEAISALSALYDCLANEKWRGDVDSVEDLLGKKVLIKDQRIETIQFGPNQKRVDVTGTYTVTHVSNTILGNVEITWQADNESIEEN